MTDHTAREALAKALYVNADAFGHEERARAWDQSTIPESMKDLRRFFADRVLASPALDAVLAERVAALAEDALLVHDVTQRTSFRPFEHRYRTLRVLRALAVALRERGQS